MLILEDSKSQYKLK